MVGIKKLGCLGVLSRKTSKNPKRMNLTRRVSGRTHIYFCGEQRETVHVINFAFVLCSTHVPPLCMSSTEMRFF